MIGRKVDLNIERPIVEKKRPLLEIKDLTINNDENAAASTMLIFISAAARFSWLAGIAGCGQKELCEAIAGLRKVESGMMIHKGDNIVGLSPKEILEKALQ